jgi:hypothetical protein
MVESSTPNFQPSDSNNVDYQKGGGYQYITWKRFLSTRLNSLSQSWLASEINAVSSHMMNVLEQTKKDVVMFALATLLIKAIEV